MIPRGFSGGKQEYQGAGKLGGLDSSNYSRKEIL